MKSSKKKSPRRQFNITRVLTGVMVEKVRGYGRALCEGAAAAAREDGAMSLRLLPCSGTLSGKMLSKLDAVIVSAAEARLVARVRKLGVPMVAVYDKAAPDMDVVDTNHPAVARIAAKHFIERGFRSFAFCGFDGKIFSDMSREVFVRHLALNNFECKVYRTPASAFRNFEDFAIANERADSVPDYTALSKWLSGLPPRTAIFCANDLRAYHVAGVCGLLGREVPGDLAVLGVDNDELLCSFSEPTLSSVDPDPRAVGRTAVKLLRSRIEGNAEPRKTIYVPPIGMAIRESSDTFPVDPPWLAEALVFIRHNIAKRISASDVFAHIGRSHTLVERTFRKVRGNTVQKEISEARFKEALRLLETSSLPAMDIARLSGFSRVQYFCNLFTRRFGRSPLAWRANPTPVD